MGVPGGGVRRVRWGDQARHTILHHLASVEAIRFYAGQETLAHVVRRLCYGLLVRVAVARHIEAKWPSWRVYRLINIVHGASWRKVPTEIISKHVQALSHVWVARPVEQATG